LVAVESEHTAEFEALLKENGIAEESFIFFVELKEKVGEKLIEVF
jgi:hypothetical protein